jgi:hypothetical protein
MALIAPLTLTSLLRTSEHSTGNTLPRNLWCCRSKMHTRATWRSGRRRLPKPAGVSHDGSGTASTCLSAMPCSMMISQLCMQPVIAPQLMYGLILSPPHQLPQGQLPAGLCRAPVVPTLIALTKLS